MRKTSLLVQSIYNSVQLSVRANGSLMGFFDCPVGLKRGCLLSPVLFSVFANKLTDKLLNNGIQGL